MKTYQSVKILLTAVALAAITSFATLNAHAGATRVSDAIWAHGEIYGTIVTPTSFNAPPPRSTDTIYSFMMSGLTGQRSISASAPGDPDYNGGRWSVKAVVFTEDGLNVHDPDGDGVANFELTSEEDLMAHYLLGHLEIMDTPIYFECPMLPRR